jgi:hypothetical protein
LVHPTKLVLVSAQLRLLQPQGSTTLTTQPGTRVVQAITVAGGGGGGALLQVEVVEQVVLELVVHFQFVEQQHIQLQ